MAIDIIINALRAVSNFLRRMRPAPDFVLVSISGTLPERRQPRPPRWRRFVSLPISEPPQVSLEEWRRRFEVLGADPRVKGIILTLGPLQAGSASLEGLRASLEHYRNQGKRIVAYLPTTSLGTYYLASVADTIVAPESAELTLHGLRAEATFLRGALDRLGIIPQFHHIAEYKTAANRFLYPEMPAPQREVVSAILDSMFAEIVGAIAQARQLPPDRVQDAIDAGRFSATGARDQRLIDLVAFEDDLPGLLGTAGAPAKILPWEIAQARIRLPYRWRRHSRTAIGVVQVIGTIVPGESRDMPVPIPLLGRSFVGHETVARACRLAERLPHIKAVVVHVESPGGSAVASDLIWREITRLQRHKPVVVHMGNVAGSGGYYIACGARHIVAGATTLTGSIGVVTGKFNAEGLLTKGAMHHEILARGKTATADSLFSAYSDAEWQILVQSAEEIYDRFKARVAAGRKRTAEEIERVARGRVWTGRQALEHGLVDSLGDFAAAVRTAKDLVHLGPDADIPVVTIRPPKAAAVPSGASTVWFDLATVADLLRERTLLLVPSEKIQL